jgi:hypothetical protein
MQKGMTSIGKMVMQAALATVLIVTGLLVFAGGRGSEVFSGNQSIARKVNRA